MIPSGREMVRANDTSFPFRPGSDFVYLTGEHEPESVLVLRPNGSGHDAVLYVRPRSPRDTDEFFKDRRYGELWIGRRHTLREKSAELGVETAHLDDLSALDDLAPGRTRVLRGLDPRVDARGPPDRPGSATRELAWAISEMKLVKDEWEIAQLQDAIDATVRGFEDVARILPGRPRRLRAPASRASSACAPGTTATASATARSSAPARTRRSCTGSATTA